MLVSHPDCQIEVDNRGKTIIKPPAILNKSSGKLSSTAWAFSDQNCGDATRGLTRAAEHRSDFQRWSIMEQAREYAHKLTPVAADGSLDENSDDEYARICKLPYFDSKLTNIVCYIGVDDRVHASQSQVLAPARSLHAVASALSLTFRSISCPPSSV